MPDNFAFKVALYIGIELLSTSNAPTLEAATTVCEWHCKKAAENTAVAVDTATGEQWEFPVKPETAQAPGECSECVHLRNEIEELGVEMDGLTRNLKGWIRRFKELQRDKELEAKESGEWEMALTLFKYWKNQTGRTKSKLTVDRFLIIQPFLKKYEIKHLVGAIAGIAYDHFTTTNKNGSTEKHNGWDLVFRDAAHVERYANKAPKGFYAHFEELQISMRRDKENTARARALTDNIPPGF